VLTKNVTDVNNLTSENQITLQNKITILCFFSDDLLQHKTNALNLNEKIYKQIQWIEEDIKILLNE
jgi:hypothetical protein